jgi:hypothetical protein
MIEENGMPRLGLNLNHEFLTALRDGVDHDSLLELVHRHQAQGLNPPEAYGILHQAWLEFGFNSSEEESDVRDNLEYVMEKIWYECPAPRR